MCFTSAFTKVITIFVLIVSIILVNLLVAQLNQAYQHVYTDMQGSDGEGVKDDSRMMKASTPPKLTANAPKKRYLKKERIVSQASFFRGDLLKFRGVYTFFPAIEDDTVWCLYWRCMDRFYRLAAPFNGFQDVFFSETQAMRG